MTAKSGRIVQAILPIVKITVTLAVLVVLWRVVDAKQVVELLVSSQPIWLVAGLIALSMQTVLSAIRWRITAGRLGLVLSLGGAIHEYYLSQIINQVLPGGVLGDASRAVRSRQQQGLMAASQAVIFERFAGQIALFMVMSIAIVLTVVAPNGLEWPSWSIPIILVIICGGFAAAFGFAAVIAVANPLRDRARTLARAFAHAVLARAVLMPQVALSLAIVLCNLAAFAFCARAVGVVLSPLIVCALVPLILFTMLVPLTITGWGLREGAAAAFLPLAGVSPSAALAASVAFGLTMLAASAPGLAAVWFQTSTASIKEKQT